MRELTPNEILQVSGAGSTTCGNCDCADKTQCLKKAGERFVEAYNQGHEDYKNGGYGRTSLWLGAVGSALGGKYGGVPGAIIGGGGGGELGRIVDAYGPAYRAYLDVKEAAEQIYGLQ